MNDLLSFDGSNIIVSITAQGVPRRFVAPATPELIALYQARQEALEAAGMALASALSIVIPATTRQGVALVVAEPPAPVFRRPHRGSDYMTLTEACRRTGLTAGQFNYSSGAKSHGFAGEIAQGGKVVNALHRAGYCQDEIECFRRANEWPTCFVTRLGALHRALIG